MLLILSSKRVNEDLRFDKNLRDQQFLGSHGQVAGYEDVRDDRVHDVNLHPFQVIIILSSSIFKSINDICSHRLQSVEREFCQQRQF